jgi:molybdenum cofactor synthesis domain-containing protein
LDKPYQAAILICSDRVSSGKREDIAGPKIAERMQKEGWEITSPAILPDDQHKIAAWLISIVATNQFDLILTSGGTGLAAEDLTPEATVQVIERRVPGIEEAMRAASLKTTPHAMLSRAVAGVSGTTLIVNLPGNPDGALENLEVIIPALSHAVALLRGEKPDP